MTVNRKTLQNGVRVVTSPTKDTNSVTILFMIKTGSRNESKDTAGISHFLEHMVFKGTKKRPTTLFISKEIESLGAQFNAYTHKEYTSFYIKTTKDNFKKSLEILSDIIFNSVLKSEEIEVEKNVILEEKKLYEENPRLFIEDYFEQTYFIDKGLSRQIVGSKKSIKRLDRKDFVDYQNKYYHSGNVVLSLSGSIPAGSQKILEASPNKPKIKKETNWNSGITKSVSKKAKTDVLYKKLDQAYFILGYPGLKYADKDFLKLKLLSNVLGGGMSSKLFQEVREKRGLAYSIYSDVGTYSDSGYLEINAGVDSKKVGESLKVIKDEAENVSQSLTDEELEIAKERLKGSISFSFEDTKNRADFYARRVIYGMKVQSLEDIIKDIDKVDLDSVKYMAKKTFSGKPTLALIGPFKNVEKFGKILSS